VAADDVSSRLRKTSVFCFFLVGLSLLTFLASTFVFQKEVLSAQATLSWDPVDAPVLAGYRLYYGTASRDYSFTIDNGMQTTCQVTDLNEGTTYYFAVTAYTAEGVETDFSTEVIYPVPNRPIYPTISILWRNRSTGQNAVWYINGTTLASAAWLPSFPDTNWTVVGTADFNGDSKPDILWRSSATGQNAVWYMDGTTFVSVASLPSFPDTNWTVVGTADFNGDGKPDILWRNPVTGENLVWYMNNTTRTSTAFLPPCADTHWTAAEVR